ncbi:pyruvate dehydrogenase E2 component (dihydrolipoamide acetyltransferase) [Oceanobacillus limi]|uniref:Dihydrolipoamide acetyltransferase component of pyruvate dehydrogenase complex n=1 Tax=Oceanobacillus limi TaxID=930131 RepID=A0A1I0AD98_9BACI|nr:dihydrolipoamide acetyltransferase family protein [Oceanobacillus limi]SES92198.1 pyruvate dehydrogenase E2 component (dihydrolipoamide acetyltransferase) [Oceanobacillus limi]
MAKEVFMPKLSSTMAVGTLLQWFKEEGETVEVGEPLFEIMTDKINIEVESYEEGVLLKRYYEVDEEIPVNAVIGYVGEAGEEVPEKAPAVDAEANADEEVETEVVETQSTQKDGASAQTEDGKVRATPAARRVARENEFDLASVVGTGPKGRIHEQDVVEAVGANKVFATPLAEKIANENGVDLREVTGTGSRGKIEKADVLAYMNGSSSSKKAEELEGERVKLKGLRKAVADKMVESTRSIPHVTLTSEVDMTKVIELRKALLPVVEAQTGYRLSFTEVIMKTVAHTLGNHPKVNASLVGDEIIMNKDVNIGLAVAVENGLIVPSVKQANKKGLAALTEVSKTLGAKARENKLTPDEMSGSTFTISNLGMYAIDGFTPIINPPETAILGVGRIVEKPVVVDGSVEVRPMMVLSLSFDHRAIDGAPAAAFLTELKESLEDPYSLLV